MPHVSELRPAPQPIGKLFVSSRRDLIDDAPRPALGGSALRPHEPLFLQSSQGRINLAQLRGPEVSDAVVQDRLQVVTTGGLAEKTEQNVFETHTVTI
jgi:hypothetical protein